MIEETGEADAEEVTALWRECGLIRPWNDPRLDFRRAIESPASAVLLAREDRVAAGTVMVGFDGHRGWVYYLSVAPSRCGRGIGRRLMDAAERWLARRGAPKIRLMVREDNVEVIAFYEALRLERQKVVTLGRFMRSPMTADVEGRSGCNCRTCECSVRICSKSVPGAKREGLYGILS